MARIARRPLDCAHATRRARKRHGHRPHREWSAALRRCRARDSAALGDPRSAWAHRHQVQLRHRAMLGLHAAHRRSTGSILQPAGLDGGRQGGDHHRGPVDRRDASGAARLDRSRCSAMRLLPVGHDHERRGAAAEASPSDRCGDRRGGPNACRCSTYHRVRQAIHLAASKMSTGGRDL